MNESPFLTVQDVAKELQIHPITAYRLLKNKTIPGFRVGGAWRVKREFLDKYVLDGHK